MAIRAKRLKAMANASIMPTANAVGFDPEPVLGNSVIGSVGEGEGVGDGTVPCPPVAVLVGEGVGVALG